MITHGEEVILNDKFENLTNNSIIISIDGSNDYNVEDVGLYIKKMFEKFYDIRLEYRCKNIPLDVNETVIISKLQRVIDKKGINVIIEVNENKKRIGYNVNELENIITENKNKISSTDEKIVQNGLDELKKISKMLK